MATPQVARPAVATALLAKRPRRTPLERLRRLRRRPVLVLCLTVLGVVALSMARPELFTPADPYAVDLDRRLLPPGPGGWFGTDDFGRDLFTRVVYGARTSLGATLVVVAAASLIGTLFGAVAGFARGYLDDVIMRVTDVMISFPLFIMAMAIVAVLGRDITNAVIAGVAIWWAQYARLVRGSVLATAAQPYVEAARVIGGSPARVLLRHVLPNSTAPVIVKASLDVSQVLLVITGLSFIGLGAQPPAAEWGAMVTIGRKFLFDAWWYPTMPGLAIFITGLSFNLLGDELVTLLDPRLRSAVQRG